MNTQLQIQFVRPDKLLYEGPIASIILITQTGELGIWPGHSSEICALGDGVVRIHPREEDGGGTFGVLVSGGYAEVDNDTVIVMADHARRVDDIEVEVVERTLKKAEDTRDSIPPHDSRRAYYENKIAWCNLLLQHANDVQRDKGPFVSPHTAS